LLCGRSDLPFGDWRRRRPHAPRGGAQPVGGVAWPSLPGASRLPARRSSQML